MRRPFRAESFGAVVAAFPTDYIFHPARLRELARVASEEGRLVIVAGVQPRGTPPDRHFLNGRSNQRGEARTRRDIPATGFAEAGLHARIECRRVGATTVILVLAERAPADLAGVPSLTDAYLAALAHLQPALTFGERHGSTAALAGVTDFIGERASSVVLRTH